MKKLASLVGVVALAFSATGCAYVTRAPVTGFIYLSTQQGETVSSNDLGAKRGEACATSILGWVATGDASVSSAAKAGGITKISHVDSTASDILGVYAEYCTVAYGN
ncbi:MAG TPA: TRL-like family protein [Polyangiaceae bacterium]|nr:TRL-like family protein [Polyangiaceae bacterium]